MVVARLMVLVFMWVSVGGIAGISHAATDHDTLPIQSHYIWSDDEGQNSITHLQTKLHDLEAASPPAPVLVHVMVLSELSSAQVASGELAKGYDTAQEAAALAETQGFYAQACHIWRHLASALTLQHDPTKELDALQQAFACYGRQETGAQLPVQAAGIGSLATDERWLIARELMHRLLASDQSDRALALLFELTPPQQLSRPYVAVWLVPSLRFLQDICSEMWCWSGDGGPWLQELMTLAKEKNQPELFWQAAEALYSWHVQHHQPVQPVIDAVLLALSDTFTGTLTHPDQEPVWVITETHQWPAAHTYDFWYTLLQRLQLIEGVQQLTLPEVRLTAHLNVMQRESQVLEHREAALASFNWIIDYAHTLPPAAKQRLQFALYHNLRPYWLAWTTQMQQRAWHDLAQDAYSTDDTPLALLALLRSVGRDLVVPEVQYTRLQQAITWLDKLPKDTPLTELLKRQVWQAWRQFLADHWKSPIPAMLPTTPATLRQTALDYSTRIQQSIQNDPNLHTKRTWPWRNELDAHLRLLSGQDFIHGRFFMALLPEEHADYQALAEAYRELYNVAQEEAERYDLEAILYVLESVYSALEDHEGLAWLLEERRWLGHYLSPEKRPEILASEAWIYLQDFNQESQALMALTECSSLAAGKAEPLRCFTFASAKTMPLWRQEAERQREEAFLHTLLLPQSYSVSDAESALSHGALARLEKLAASLKNSQPQHAEALMASVVETRVTLAKHQAMQRSDATVTPTVLAALVDQLAYELKGMQESLNEPLFTKAESVPAVYAIADALAYPSATPAVVSLSPATETPAWRGTPISEPLPPVATMSSATLLILEKIVALGDTLTQEAVASNLKTDSLFDTPTLVTALTRVCNLLEPAGIPDSSLPPAARQALHSIHTQLWHLREISSLGLEPLYHSLQIFMRERHPDEALAYLKEYATLGIDAETLPIYWQPSDEPLLLSLFNMTQQEELADIQPWLLTHLAVALSYVYEELEQWDAAVHMLSTLTQPPSLQHLSARNLWTSQSRLAHAYSVLGNTQQMGKVLQHQLETLTAQTTLAPTLLNSPLPPTLTLHDAMTLAHTFETWGDRQAALAVYNAPAVQEALTLPFEDLTQLDPAHLTPDAVQVMHDRALLLESLGDHQAAKEVFAQLLELWMHAADIETLDYFVEQRVSALLDRGDTSQALQLLDHVLSWATRAGQVGMYQAAHSAAQWIEWRSVLGYLYPQTNLPTDTTSTLTKQTAALQLGEAATLYHQHLALLQPALQALAFDGASLTELVVREHVGELGALLRTPEEQHVLALILAFTLQSSDLTEAQTLYLYRRLALVYEQLDSLALAWEHLQQLIAKTEDPPHIAQAALGVRYELQKIERQWLQSNQDDLNTLRAAYTQLINKAKIQGDHMLLRSVLWQQLMFDMAQGQSEAAEASWQAMLLHIKPQTGAPYLALSEAQAEKSPLGKEALVWHQRSETLALIIQNESAYCRARLGRGKSHYILEDVAQAQSILTELTSSPVCSRVLSSLQEAYYTLGVLAFEQQLFDAAEQDLTQTLTETQETHDHFRQAWAALKLADLAYITAPSPLEASTAADEVALSLMAKQPHSFTQETTGVLERLARTYYQLEQFDKAQQTYQHLANEAKARGLPELELSALTALLQVHVSQENTSKNAFKQAYMTLAQRAFDLGRHPLELPLTLLWENDALKEDSAAYLEVLEQSIVQLVGFNRIIVLPSQLNEGLRHWLSLHQLVLQATAASHLTDDEDTNTAQMLQEMLAHIYAFDLEAEYALQVLVALAQLHERQFALEKAAQVWEHAAAVSQAQGDSQASASYLAQAARSTPLATRATALFTQLLVQLEATGDHASAWQVLALIAKQQASNSQEYFLAEQTLKRMYDKAKTLNSTMGQLWALAAKAQVLREAGRYREALHDLQLLEAHAKAALASHPNAQLMDLPLAANGLMLPTSSAQQPPYALPEYLLRAQLGQAALLARLGHITEAHKIYRTRFQEARHRAASEKVMELWLWMCVYACDKPQTEEVYLHLLNLMDSAPKQSELYRLILPPPPLQGGQQVSLLNVSGPDVFERFSSHAILSPAQAYQEITVQKWLLRLAQTHQSTWGELNALWRLTLLYQSIDQKDKVATYEQALLTRAETVERYAWRKGVLLERANHYETSGHLSDAISFHFLLMKLYTHTLLANTHTPDDPINPTRSTWQITLDQMNTLGDLTRLHHGSGDIANAQGYAEAWLLLGKEYDPYNASQARNSLIQILLAGKQDTEAIALFQEELLFLRQAFTAESEVSTLLGLLEALLRTQNFDEAQTRAYELLSAISHTRGNGPRLITDKPLEAVQKGYYHEEAAAHYALGYILEERDGDARAALQHFSKALALYEALPVSSYNTRTWDRRMAIVWRFFNAKRFYTMAQASQMLLDQAREHNLDTYHLANALNTHGEVLQRLGEYAAALPLFEEALPLWAELDESYMYATNLLDVGESYVNITQYEQARPVLEQALLFLADEDDDASRASIHYLLGVTLLQLSSDPQTALHHLHTALDLQNDDTRQDAQNIVDIYQAEALISAASDMSQQP